MKRFLGVLLSLMIFLGLAACAADGGSGNGAENSGGEDANRPAAINRNILVAYFSCTDTTERIAEHIAAETKGTLYEIMPEILYTADDLKYYTNGRADREQSDSSARPAISGSADGMQKYGVVFLGYPIWHGQAPRIISTFLESYDFSGKTIVPFCTSHSSGIGNSDKNLHSLAPDAEWLSGRRFASGTPQNAVAEWINGLGLKLAPDVSEFGLESGVNGRAPTVTLNSGYK